MHELDFTCLAQIGGGAYFWDDVQANLNAASDAQASKLIPFPDNT